VGTTHPAQAPFYGPASETQPPKWGMAGVYDLRRGPSQDRQHRQEPQEPLGLTFLKFLTILRILKPLTGFHGPVCSRDEPSVRFSPARGAFPENSTSCQTPPPLARGTWHDSVFGPENRRCHVPRAKHTGPHANRAGVARHLCCWRKAQNPPTPPASGGIEVFQAKRSRNCPCSGEHRAGQELQELQDRQEPQLPLSLTFLKGFDLAGPLVAAGRVLSLAADNVEDLHQLCDFEDLLDLGVEIE